MWNRLFLATVALAFWVHAALGQTTIPLNLPPQAWRNAADAGPAAASAVVQASATSPVVPASATAPESHLPIARVTAGSGTLPNEQGQLWREYDISPYTARVTSTSRPEQAIVDWIIRETGYETWHGEPLAILSAGPRTLRVYHTPQVQAVVADIVDRFVGSEAQTHTFSLRVVTVNSPNWRERAQRVLRPVQVQTPGAQAWLLEKEAAAMLVADLRRRIDFREHSSPHLMVNNGQSSVVTATRGRNYVRDVIVRPEAWPGFEPQMGIIDEGFSLELSPLLAIDARTIDATLKCEIDQVERMVPVMLDVATAASPRQRTKIEVPQLAHARFHERFRWPTEQVLLVSLGLVPPPVPTEGSSILPLPIGMPPRAELLVFVESHGKSGEPPRAATASRPESGTYRGRY